MASISTSVGLTTGFPIQATVDQLIALQAKPRDVLTARATALNNKQVAITSLTALLIGLQTTTKRLSTASLFTQRVSTSSAPDVLGVNSTGTPALGSYTFTPIQKTQAQQLQSTRIASNTAPLGAGKFSIGFGGFVDGDTSLDILNAGEGFARGKIRITDRSGATTDVDLSYARTANDVIKAINNNGKVNVSANIVGDRFQLTDQTGQTASNLKVQEVSGGAAAASLGLNGVDVASTTATGQDVIGLFDQLSLGKLNDGLGVRVNTKAADFKVSLRDGSSFEVDLQRLAVAGTKASGVTNPAVGADARVRITSVKPGSEFADVNLVFEHDDAIVAGAEQATFDASAKTLTVKINSGTSTAADVSRAINTNATVSKVFTADLPAGNAGSGLVSVTDTAITSGPAATATSSSTLGINAAILFKAIQPGAAFDNVEISFVDDPSITAGAETVQYDDSDPAHKKLSFHIQTGVTTASNIIAALAGDATASQYFTAENAPGSDGSGPVSINDDVTTAGGAIVEPVPIGNETTLGAVVAAINAAAGGQALAKISADGDRLEIQDLTVDSGGTFAVTALNGSFAASDLGLTATASDDTISTRRLLAGFNTTLLQSFDGGKGLSGLGVLSITNRAGGNTQVDLSGAETLDDVIRRINDSAAGITAAVNDARNGIKISDTTGSTAGNLIVTDGDGTSAATKLGIAVNSATSSVNSGSLRRNSVNQNTLLSSLNGGAGVATGTLRITDTSGAAGTLNLTSDIKSVGDLLGAIDKLGLAITARLNDAGDGIVLVDTADGAEKLTVTEGSSTVGRDLHLLGESVTLDVNGEERQAINGSSTLTITLDEDDSLDDLVTRLNALKSGFTAAVINDGSSVKPYRLSIFSQKSGTAGQLLIDTTGLSFNLQETVAAQDALLLYGAPGQANGGILVASATDTFSNVLPGVTLNVKNSSTTPVTVTVGASDSTLVTSVQATVDAYNRLFDKLREFNKYDTTTNTAGILQGNSSVLRVETDISRLVTNRYFGVGSIQTLEAIGISINTEGKMAFDSSKFQAKFAEDPTGVQKFLADEKLGVTAKLHTAIEQLAGVTNSLLINQAKSLSRQIETYSAKIDFYNEKLDRSRERLLTQFYNMELAISKIKNNQSVVDSLAYIGPYQK